MNPIATARTGPLATARAPLPRWKRAIDLAFCIAVLPLLAITTLCVGILMAFASPGPILYTQQRIGYQGRRFRLFKFRTMHVGAPTAPHQAHFAQIVRSSTPMEKLDGRGDSRLIPGGWLLRACGIDELPQIINVLRGEMSIVGPRPCLPYEYEQYTAEHRRRFEVCPGLTGLWQVSGKNQTTFEEMIRLDVSYARTRSLRLDLRILLRTLPALVAQVKHVHRTRQRRRREEKMVFARGTMCTPAQQSDSRT